LARERGAFDFEKVARHIADKLIRRHPHVFGEARGLDAASVKALWGRIKAEEKREREQEAIWRGNAAKGKFLTVTDFGAGRFDEQRHSGQGPTNDHDPPCCIPV
jgi:hypothetical protein